MTIDTQLKTETNRLIVAFRGTMTFHDYGASDALLDRVVDQIGASNGAIDLLVFDLAEVDLIDSHWLGMFVRALKRAQEKGAKVALRRPQSSVRRLLDLVQFGRVFDIQD
jgi:anti-anti-sigma factor